MHITRMGSRGIATQDYDGYDVVFPSGQPAADLITGRRAAEGHPATTRELARTGTVTQVPLSEIGEFVMVTGRFEARGSRGETLVMRAPCSDGGPAAHLRVVLRGDGLLTPDRELPEGQFQAHCLGKVTSWDPAAREIVLQYPVAVFR